MRRVWKCPECDRIDRTAGHVTAHRCACNGSSTWMTLVEEQRRQTPPFVFQTPREIIVDELQDEPSQIEPSPTAATSSAAGTESTSPEIQPERQQADPVEIPEEQPVEIESNTVVSEETAPAETSEDSRPDTETAESSAKPAEPKADSEKQGKKRRRNRKRGRRRNRGAKAKNDTNQQASGNSPQKASPPSKPKQQGGFGAGIGE